MQWAAVTVFASANCCLARSQVKGMSPNRLPKTSCGSARYHDQCMIVCRETYQYYKLQKPQPKLTPTLLLKSPFLIVIPRLFVPVSLSTQTHYTLLGERAFHISLAMSNKPIFLATHPRACSTAFERVGLACALNAHVVEINHRSS